MPPQTGEGTSTTSSGSGRDNRKGKQREFRNRKGPPRWKPRACEQCRHGRRRVGRLEQLSPSTLKISVIQCAVEGSPSRGCEECRNTNKECSYIQRQEGTDRAFDEAQALTEPGPNVPYHAPAVSSTQRYAEKPFERKGQRANLASVSLDGTQQALLPIDAQQYYHQSQLYPHPAYLAEPGHPQTDFVAATIPPMHSMGFTGLEYQEHNPYTVQHDLYRPYDLTQSFNVDVPTEAVGHMPGPTPRQSPQPEDDSKDHGGIDT
ncbi:hypothetical protein CLCR_04322 [Cladophialophora carrionii]|uniref:Zn(2)-C6 fungal-type domain-containing protein n=1 Tax=Cladophialophora carrionii TaxID=86049 RepID=A0A1C1CHF1_9EURO|nr:hypothetical protein CLCR_04322 [Cladophialophora carrionii]